MKLGVASDMGADRHHWACGGGTCRGQTREYRSRLWKPDFSAWHPFVRVLAQQTNLSANLRDTTARTDAVSGI
jgi:hypothetical protein